CACGSNSFNKLARTSLLAPWRELSASGEVSRGGVTGTGVSFNFRGFGKEGTAVFGRPTPSLLRTISVPIRGGDASASVDGSAGGSFDANCGPWPLSQIVT